MSFTQEFREFALKGNVMDLAVGVIIGGAFGKIVESVVNDLVMPVISRLTPGSLDFTNLFIPLADVPAGIPHTLEAVRKAGVPVFAWGNFLTVGLNFLILAFIIFQMVKFVNRLRRDTPAAPAAPADDVVLLREIRDALKAR
jgi:large conductance mechanosensitive channel